MTTAPQRATRRTTRRTIPRRLGVDLAMVLLIGGVAWFASQAFNRPVAAPDWDGTLAGLSFSPFQPGQSPLADDYPSPEEIARDLTLLKPHTRALRTYGTAGTLGEIPALAAAQGFTVTAGAWIGGDRAGNRAEIERLVALARERSSIARLLVGNEALLREETSVAAMTDYLRQVRRRVAVPVSTSEPWHIWLDHPELAREVDFIAAHVLPYWEGLPLDEAVAYVLLRYDQLRAAFPDKPVVLTEVGWPSDGRLRGRAAPSPANQGAFLRRFLQQAEARGIDYFALEAFDQPWKRAIEGAIGAYWGLYDAERRPKFAAEGPLDHVPGWRALTAVGIALGAFLALALLHRLDALRPPGRLFLAALVQGLSLAAVWLWHLHASRYLGPADWALLAALLPAFGLLLALYLAEGIEFAECLWGGPLRRAFRPAPEGGPGDGPKVSIHLPICREPPDMVIETLAALGRLDYADFEVLVVDNNTEDERLWRPVAAFCRALGPRFRFFHLGAWPGFKAGALNFALRHSDPNAEIVGVVDSDYRVERNWLKALVPLFADPGLSLVQAPQDYRDGAASLFKRFCFWEYAGFFHLGMVRRNEHNAIIQHGTMTLLRRAAVEAAGGWAEWCICEDAELGLRLNERRLETAYVRHSFGRGVLPDSFAAYRQQRFRWAYGAMQIIRRHARQVLTGRQGTLTGGQRYHYLAGWLPWMADGLHLAVSLIALLWTAGILALPKHFDYPLPLFAAAVLGFALFKLVKLLWLYRARVGSRWGEALGAATAGLGLTYIVGKAVWQGLVTKGAAFRRTPKCRPRPGLGQALAVVREETALLCALLAAASAVLLARGGAEPGAHLWAAFLLAQAIPYGAALWLSLVNGLPAIRGRAHGRTRRRAAERADA